MGDRYYEKEVDAPSGRIFLENREERQPLSANTTDYDYGETESTTDSSGHPSDLYTYHPWGIFFTIIGTVLLDFDADACQSPSRAYLLDVTLPEDHAIGLATFTIMAGLGGSLGYAMGGIDWGALGTLFGGHVRFVFTVVLFIFISCVVTTITSFNEIPLDIITNPFKRKSVSEGGSGRRDTLEDDNDTQNGNTGHLSTKETSFSQA